ncbi:MAG: sulfotransferase [Desulfobacterales bacterium]
MSDAIKPILVTGSHRSGTTWAGRILALAPHAGYIHEPFNIRNKLSVVDSPFNCWFQYVCEENENPYKAALDSVIQFKYPLLGNLAKARGFKDVVKIFRHQRITLLHRIRKNTPVVKDPIAFFSAEWLSKTYGMNVLVMIRHPAAYCSSLKIKNWKFNFNNLLNQPLLMDRYLGPFENEIREFAKEEQSIIDQAILLWNCIHHTATLYQEDHPEWLFVRHEDLSNDPLGNFESIYRKFGLAFTPAVESGILETSGVHNPAEQQPGRELKRNSKENIKNWKKRLRPEEIETVKIKTSEISSAFYEDDEW